MKSMSKIQTTMKEYVSMMKIVMKSIIKTHSEMNGGKITMKTVI